MTAVLTIVLGVGVGLALGALGGGGSTLAVPILVFIAGLTPQEATTASLLVVGVGAAVGAIEHVRQGNVRVGLGLLFGAAGIIGSRIGSSINRMIDGDLLLAGFAVLIVFVAVRMYRASAPTSPSDRPAVDSAATNTDDSPHAAARAPFGRGQVTVNASAPAPAPSPPAPTRSTSLGDSRTMVRLIVAATAVGLLTGLFGVGGGFVIVPALVLVLGFEPKQAIGTSLVVIAVNAMIALGMRAGELDIDWSIVGPFLATVTVGAVAGSRLAARIAADRLTRSFAIMLAVIGVYTFVAAVV